MDHSTVAAQPRTGKRRALVATVAASKRYKGLKRLTLMQMASYGDPDGSEIWPALATVAEEIGLTDRSVRRHVRAFEADGVLQKIEPPKQHKPAVYRLNIEALQADLRPDSGVRSERRARPDSGDAQTGLWRHSDRTPESADHIDHSEGRLPRSSDHRESDTTADGAASDGRADSRPPAPAPRFPSIVERDGFRYMLLCDRGCNVEGFGCAFQALGTGDERCTDDATPPAVRDLARALAVADNAARQCDDTERRHELHDEADALRDRLRTLAEDRQKPTTDGTR